MTTELSDEILADIIESPLDVSVWYLQECGRELVKNRAEVARLTETMTELQKHRLAFRRYSDAPHETGLYPWEAEDEIDGYPDGRSGGPYYHHEAVAAEVARLKSWIDRVEDERFHEAQKADEARTDVLRLTAALAAEREKVLAEIEARFSHTERVSRMTFMEWVAETRAAHERQKGEPT